MRSTEKAVAEAKEALDALRTRREELNHSLYAPPGLSDSERVDYARKLKDAQPVLDRLGKQIWAAEDKLQDATIADRDMKKWAQEQSTRLADRWEKTKELIEELPYLEALEAHALEAWHRYGNRANSQFRALSDTLRDLRGRIDEIKSHVNAHHRAVAALQYDGGITWVPPTEKAHGRL